MNVLKEIGGEPLEGSGFENEPVVTDDGVMFVNGESVLIRHTKQLTAPEPQSAKNTSPS
jgi:hypothetical protein